MEVLQARKVAIKHVYVGIVTTYLCFSLECGVVPFLGVLPSTLVAGCVKHRIAYMLWSLMGGVLFVLNAKAAVTTFTVEYINPGVFIVQVVQCVFSLFVVHAGYTTASAIMRQPVHPVESHQIGTP